MSARTRTATAMAFRDQRRRPLVLILLVIVPVYVITKSVAQTQPTPRRIGLPGDVWVTTTMKALHGPEMAKISVAFVAALVGVFVMQSALQGDRRLVIAGFRPREAVLARLAVLTAATALVVAVSALVTAVFFTPASWGPLILGLLLIGLIYAAIGALAGALLDKLAATYLMLFLVMTDLGVVQTPMFHATPGRWAVLLPGYGPTRVMINGAFSQNFHAAPELLLTLAWLAALAIAVYLLLRRAVGTRA
jgi:ABC-2 family transporter protein